MIWESVIEKIERRLAGWKRLYLSKGGRITLIKSTLSNLPTYFLSLFPIPASVAGGLGEEFKFHLVKWEHVCCPISGGGLGIRNLKNFNRALLGKWLWRFAQEHDSLWKQVVVNKYGGLWGEWCTREVRRAYGVGLWKHIRRGWGVFNHHVKLCVGTGSRIKFWRDVWCASRALKDLYPSLFQLARDKDVLVEEVMELEGGQFLWNINFSRAAQDWELSTFAEFYSLIYSIRPNSQQEDVLWWSLSGKGNFSVRSFYKALTHVPPSTCPWRKIWRNKVPPKVSFFVWTASQGKILTTDNLRKRRIIIADWYCMCRSEGESVDHLLLHCDMVRALWNEVFLRLDIAWVMPKTVEMALASWSNIRGSKPIKVIWKMIPLCIMWVVWQERNERTFEDRARSVEELKLLFFITLCNWAIAVDFNGKAMHDFLISNVPT
ncbi:hypothetical protein I3760_09G116800 [Carya illinoinensis]|nr:hypothetical protein I3760_09G116800 [Carya illinoinensis]